MKNPCFLFILLFSATLLNAQSSGSGYICFNADSIYYEWAGTGQTIIQIHDGLLHHEVWDDQFACFSENFKVIRYDRRGYGASSAATESYSHLDDLRALYKHLDIEHAVLLACSSGGALAIDFTLQYPQMVDGLVLVGAVVGGFSYTPHMHKRGGHLPDHFENEIEESVYYVKSDPYEIYWENKKAKERALKMLYAYPLKENRRQNYTRPEIPAYRRLNEVEIPALVMVGEFDIPDVHAHAGAINAGIRNSKRILVPGSGHLIPLEQAEAFNEIVLEFLFGLYTKE